LLAPTFAFNLVTKKCGACNFFALARNPKSSVYHRSACDRCACKFIAACLCTHS
jgi:hypothetical protein